MRERTCSGKRVDVSNEDEMFLLQKANTINHGNKWMASASSVRGGSGLAPYDGLYNNKFIYDGNGNILHQDRRDNNGVIFDSMSYQYNRDVNGKLVQNRLYHVNDAASSSAATDDIDDEGTFTATASTINTANNYGYDGIGNMTRDASEEIDSIKWTVYGKIKEIKRSSGSTKKNLKFGYDASGNRVNKSSYTSSGVWIESTYYVRDAQGNVMSTYHENASDSSLSYKWLEADVYGSSRIGLTYPDKEMVGADTVNEVVYDTLNKRQYELSNHLGNVLTVAYDHSIAVDSNADHIVDYHLADLASASDYSPFGAPLSGRGFSGEKYRYGFNGKEKDDEVKGSGDQYDYGMRIYDARLGRFLSVAPIGKDFAYYSLYSYAGNKPILCVDLDGLEDVRFTDIDRKQYMIVSFNREDVNNFLAGKLMTLRVHYPTATKSQFEGINHANEEKAFKKVFEERSQSILCANEAYQQRKKTEPTLPGGVLGDISQPTFIEPFKPTPPVVHPISTGANPNNLYFSAADQSWLPGATFHAGSVGANQGDLGEELEGQLDKMITEINSGAKITEIHISLYLLNDLTGQSTFPVGYRYAAENGAYNIKKYFAGKIPDKIKITTESGVLQKNEANKDKQKGINITPR